MAERPAVTGDGELLTAEKFAYVHGWKFGEDEFIQILEHDFGVTNYERRWELLDLRDKGVPQPVAYPEGWDIANGHPPQGDK